MTIAIVAPVDERVPPPKYGGIELFVYNLAKRLAEQGCRVIMLASGDSLPLEGVELVACSETAARLLPGAENPKKRYDYWIDGAKKAAEYIVSRDDIDIIVNNNGWPFLDLVESLHITQPVVTILHGTLAEPSEQAHYRRQSHRSYISISDSQRDPIPDMNYLATVPHGIDIDIFPFREDHDGYFAWLGRFTPDKGPLETMKVSEKTGKVLKMGGKVDPTDRVFFETYLADKFDKYVLNLGELDHREKTKLLSGAEALIFPLQWPEPFGLVMIESLACGTPVVALRKGSIPEIVEDGVTGLICDSVDEMVRRINKGELKDISREACREAAKTRFSDRLMAERYLDVFRSFIEDTNNSKHNK
jgi:glycosyltransferase involved in cell wall biosynthesis